MVGLPALRYSFPTISAFAMKYGFGFQAIMRKLRCLKTPGAPYFGLAARVQRGTGRRQRTNRSMKIEAHLLASLSELFQRITLL